MNLTDILKPRGPQAVSGPDKGTYKPRKLSLFEKLDRIFTKEPLSAEDFGRDGFMLLRFLSMKQEYTMTMNRVQRYQGVLGHRLAPLMQELFAEADKAPFLDFIKKEAKDYRALSEESFNRLKKLFGVGKKRMQEYLPCIWATDEDVKAVWGDK